MENTVQQLRRQAGDTQAQLAAALGVSRQTVIAIERGRYDPSLGLALRIARHFHTTVEEIFHDEPAT